MKQFQINPDRFNEIRKQLLTKYILIMFLASCFGMAVIYVRFDKETDNYLSILLPLLVITYIFISGITKNLKRQKEMILSYVIKVDADCITREQLNTPTISIPKSAIQEIVKYPNGSITVKGASSADMITILPQIEKNEEVEQLLAVLHPVSEKNNLPFLQRYNTPLSVGSIGMMAGVFFSNNVIVVAVCGTVISLILGYSFVEIQRSNNLDQKVKNASWTFLLVMLSVIGTMYLKLGGRF